MAKIIKYKFLSGENLLDAEIQCQTQKQFDDNYPAAEKEAVGEIIVEGEFEPEADTTSTDDVLNALLGVIK